MTYLQILGELSLKVRSVQRARRRLLDSNDPEFGPHEYAVLEGVAFLLQRLDESLRDDLAMGTANGFLANLMPSEVLHGTSISRSTEIQ